MADNTLVGIAGVVLISLIAALFFAVSSADDVSLSDSIGTGQAAYQGVASADTCEPKRFCDGSRLIIIHTDCSTAEAFCQEGCDPHGGVCL